MNTVYLLDKENAFCEILKINILKSYHLNIQDVSNLAECSNEIINSQGLLIIRETSCAPSELHAFVSKIKLGFDGVKVLILGTSTYEPWIYKMSPESSWKTVVERIGSILNVQKRNFEQVVEKYLSIPISYFMSIKLTSLDTDIYLRIKKSESEFQYIKRFKSEDQFNVEDVHKYFEHGVTDLYVTRDAYIPLIDKLTSHLLTQLSHSSEQVELISNVYEVTKERLIVLGIDETTVQLVDESIKGMEKAVGEKNTLLNYLNNLKSNKMSFAFSHSYLTCLLLNRILKSFEWDSKIVREKVTYLSFFHDISLPHDELAMINSNEDLALKKLKPNDESMVFNHALLSANILDSFPQVPMGVYQLVKEHHGSKTGSGFPDKMYTTISPIAIMFVVIENFVIEFLSLSPNPQRSEVEAILKKLSGIYTKGTYSQTMKILKKAILNNE